MKGTLRRLVSGGVAAVLAAVAAPAAAAPAEWLEVDYSSIVDRRQLTHSGESVGQLLRQLAGRPLPEVGDRPADRLAHQLLDPLLEPYAVLLPDVLDALTAVRTPPYVDLGSLWAAGERQPAWAELLRARHYVVESNGQGQLRLILPIAERSGEPAPTSLRSQDAAERAFNRAWPVVRHLLAAERRRLSSAAAPATALDLEVHAFVHRPERSTFALGTAPFVTRVEDTRPDGRRVPLDLAAMERFLQSRLQLEGARLETDGSLRLLGSDTGQPPTMLGEPLSLADFAVAYRAVFHGGLAEPYMSLDRAFAPQSSIVNYGGRLRDTALGWVSLLCDIRFKTFSLGIDIVTGTDLREGIRHQLPEFRTHLERFAADPLSASVGGQQTRMWFYPDSVDITLSAEGDVFVLRSARMSAASERVTQDAERGGRGEEPAWTRLTVDGINRSYGALARLFPEMADLDQVVRLLSLFTWLRQLEADGQRIPELDVLLTLELPAMATPRVYPQLLAFNALPPAGAQSAVEVFDRVPLVESLDQLSSPAPGPRLLPASRRFARAMAALDRRDTQHASLLDEAARVNPSTLRDDELDLWAYRAERLRMHGLVLATGGPQQTRSLEQRRQRGEATRVFSVGIGGLDLGMGPALRRAKGRGETGPGVDNRRAGETLSSGGGAAWRVDPPNLPTLRMKDHGIGQAGGGRTQGTHLVTQGRNGERWLWTLDGPASPDVVSRRLTLDGSGRASEVTRVERGRYLRFGFGRGEGSVKIEARETTPEGIAPSTTDLGDNPLPEGLTLLRLGSDGGAGESPAVSVALEVGSGGARRQMATELPRSVLQRLLLGRSADLQPDRPLPGFDPLPPVVGADPTVMALIGESQSVRPWSGPVRPVSGEEDPLLVAAALNSWWRSASSSALPPSSTAVVGVDAERSPTRWASAPKVGGVAPIPLLLPADAFAGPRRGLRAALERAWKAGPVLDELPERLDAPLLVVISAEAAGPLADRLERLSRRPALAGKLLAVWSLAAELRGDLPHLLLTQAALGGLGIATVSIDRQRSLETIVSETSSALAGPPRRAERLPGPWLWCF